MRGKAVPEVVRSKVGGVSYKAAAPLFFLSEPGVDAMSFAGNRFWLGVSGKVGVVSDLTRIEQQVLSVCCIRKFYFKLVGDADGGQLLYEGVVEVSGWLNCISVAAELAVFVNLVDCTEFCFRRDGRRRVGWLIGRVDSLVDICRMGDDEVVVVTGGEPPSLDDYEVGLFDEWVMGDNRSDLVLWVWFWEAFDVLKSYCSFQFNDMVYEATKLCREVGEDRMGRFSTMSLVGLDVWGGFNCVDMNMGHVFESYNC